MSKALIGTNNIHHNVAPARQSFLDDYTFSGNGTGQVQFTNVNTRGDISARALDAGSYVQALEESLIETFNDGDFAEAVSEHVLSAEFRPFGTQPTPIIKHVMKDRSVTFLKNGSYDPAKDAPTVTAEPGDTLFINAGMYDGNTKSGVLASMSTKVYDHALMAGWTDGALEMAVTGITKDFCQVISDSAVSLLEKQEDLQTTKVTLTSSTKPVEVANEVLDALTMNLPLHLGGSLSEFCVAMSKRMQAILDRGAQSMGHVDASSLLGCEIIPYTGDAGAMYLVPKGYSMLSFRMDRNDQVVNVRVSRDAPRQSWTVELNAVFEVLINGMVKVKDKANFDVQRDASFPLVHCLDFS